jgi:hypothetical protein
MQVTQMQRLSEIPTLFVRRSDGSTHIGVKSPAFPGFFGWHRRCNFAGEQMAPLRGRCPLQT